MDRSGVASISGRTQHGGDKLSQSSRSLMGHLIDELFEQEFRTHFLHPGLNFNSIVRQRSFVYKRTSQQYDLLHKRTIRSGTLTAHPILSEAIITFFSNSTYFHSSQRHPDFDVMQYLRRLLPVRLVFTRGVVFLHYKDEL